MASDQFLSGYIDNRDGIALAALMSLHLNQLPNDPFFDPATVFAQLNDIETVTLSSESPSEASLALTIRVVCRDTATEASRARFALFADMLDEEFHDIAEDELGLVTEGEILRDGPVITWHVTVTSFDRLLDRLL